MMQPCLIQISPLAASNQDEKSNVHSNASRMSAPMAKLFLQKQKWSVSWDSIQENDDGQDDCISKWNVRRGTLSTEVILSYESNSSSSKNESIMFPIVNWPSQDPTDCEGNSCLIRAYCICSQGGEGMNYLYMNDVSTTNIIEVVDGTLVQILAPIKLLEYNVGDKLCHIPKVMGENLGSTFNIPSRCHESSLPSVLMGDIPLGPILDNKEAQRIFQCHDVETVKALTLRMKMLLSTGISVGTTSDALQNIERKRTRRKRMQTRVDRYWDQQRSIFDSTWTSVSSEVPPPQNQVTKEAELKALFSHGALTVHCPQNGSGKTLLVSTIARSILKCRTHVLNGSVLFAKYGASGADAALESLLHGILIAAATGSNPAIDCTSNDDGQRNMARVCVILDHLETFVPLPGSAGRGDPSVPALNAMAAYLNKVVHSIQKKKEFPFPTKNPLYNLGTKGFVLPLELCLVGIVTCDDDGGRKAMGIGPNQITVLDALGENRYHLPSLSPKVRHDAICSALHNEGIVLSEEAKNKLVLLAASEINARGVMFQKVASAVRAVVHQHGVNGVKEASFRDIKEAFQLCKGYTRSLEKRATEVSFVEDTHEDASKDLFSSVGGNSDAKTALQDALAIDSKKMQLLSKFGMSPPTGILLYGPPGTGKTLLAKATARLMQINSTNGSREDTHIGLSNGSFISLKASDVVRAEVGNSEKLIVSAFETARKNTPSVVFIDEFQALFTSRDGEHTGGGKGSGRLASTLLQCMDDVTRWRDEDANISSDACTHKNRVVILGATNAPWMVDKAFLRPGRFDRVVHVGLPTLLERKSILRVHIQQMKLHEKVVTELVCEELAKSCVGFSGADLAALIRIAAVRCLNDGGQLGVERRHFMDARKRDMTLGSSSTELVERILRWRL